MTETSTATDDIVYELQRRHGVARCNLSHTFGEWAEAAAEAAVADGRLICVVSADGPDFDLFAAR